MPRLYPYLKNRRFVFVSGLIIGISLLHYLTGLRKVYYHSFYGELYVLPLVLAGLWSGLRGSVAAIIGVNALYVPFLAMRHQPLDPAGFDRILGILVMDIASIILGVLTDRKAAQEKALKESERLAAVGRTVIAVAHEMRTPLIAIAGFTMQVKKRLIDELCVEKLEIVLDECRRLETLSREMLDISRSPVLHRTKEDPVKLVEKCADIVRGPANRHAKVVVEINADPGMPGIYLDPERMEQVFINLLSNAVDASADGALIQINICEKGKLLFFDIVDTGPGIPEDVREKIFNLFFTSKKHGTGLGLPISRKIVRAHGGDIIHFNNAECGSTFRTMLPAANKINSDLQE